MATNIEYFNNSGSNNWYAPHGVRNVAVEGIGAGGAGANRNSNGSGGGGAGGAYAKLNNFAAVAGNTYPLSVGVPGNTNNNSNGTDTSFNTTTLLAKGGNTAGRNNATGQTAFANASSTGDVVFRGGNGATGASPNANNGGGGGSSGGNNGVGVDGVGNNGGISSLPGGAGAGGNGAKNGSAVGINGTFPGGAGGGATRNSTTNRSGGNGANGQVKITYDYTPNAIDLDGTTQYGSISHMTQWETMTDWYGELWVKTKAAIGPYSPYFSIERDTLSGDVALDYQLGLHSEAGEGSQGLNWYQAYDGANVADGFIDNADAPVPIGVWTHIGARHNFTTKVTTIIVNGRPWISYPGGFPQVGDGNIQLLASSILKLGRNGAADMLPASVGGFFRLYNRFVGNSEIYANYQKTLDASKEQSGLIVNINFSEQGGTTLDNQAGGNDMTLTGTPPWVPGPATTAKSYQNGYKYPYISDSADDAEQVVSSGDTNITSTGIELVYDGATQQIVGLRFQSIAIPQGSTIVHAYLRMLAYDNFANTTDVTVKGQATDDAAAFTAGAANTNISSRSTTTASVSWPIPAITDREMVSSPDLAMVIQEIIDRGGWVSGNDLALIISGVDTDNKGFESADQFPYHLAASLEIEYYKRTTVTFTVDGIITSGTATVTFTVDGIVAERNSKTFTVDGIVLVQNTNTFTVDGIVLDQTTQTFTVDGIVLETTLNTFTVDGIVLQVQTVTFTVDAIVKEINNATFTVDGIVLETMTNTLTVDAIVFATNTQSFTVDGVVLVQNNEVSFTVDGIVLTVNDSTFTVDGVVKEINTKTFTVDGIVFATYELTFTVDGIVFATNQVTFTVDGIVKTQGNEVTFTVDGVVLAVTTVNFTVDALVLATNQVIFTVDGIVFATNIVSFTVDGIVIEQGTLFSFTVDGIVFATNTITFTVDGIVLATTLATFTVDAIVLVVNTLTFTVDAVVLETKTATFTVDGVVKVLNNQVTITVDGIVLETFTASFTVDAIVKTLGNQVTFTVDAVVLQIGATQFTVDGIVKSLESATFTVDGIVQVQGNSVSFTVDGLISQSSNVTFTVDGIVVIRKTNEITFTVDGVIALTPFGPIGGKGQGQGGLWKKREQNRPIANEVPIIGDPREIPVLVRKRTIKVGDLFGE